MTAGHICNIVLKWLAYEPGIEQRLKQGSCDINRPHTRFIRDIDARTAYHAQVGVINGTASATVCLPVLTVQLRVPET